MLREARIVMPHNRKLTSTTDHSAHGKLRVALLEAFGGYTLTSGSGGWFDEVNQRNTNDDVGIYDVAIEANRDASWDKLFQIAMQAGRELNQQAVYIRYPDGSVDIASCAVKPTDDRSHYDKAEDAYNAPKVPLGGRRLPAVGEIWEASNGATVAVVADAYSLIDGGYNVVVLKAASAGFKAGAPYNVDLDGKVLPDKSSHPRDLKRFVKDF